LIAHRLDHEWVIGCRGAHKHARSGGVEIAQKQSRLDSVCIPPPLGVGRLRARRRCASALAMCARLEELLLELVAGFDSEIPERFA
jgi:hypothetical protein